MATKQAAKGELQKLKALTDSTDVWSRRVQKFWKSTSEICLSASESLTTDSSAASRLQGRLKDLSETVCTGVGNVKDVAHSRYGELNRNFQETTKSRQKSACCQEISRRIGDASVEISTAILSTFHHQASRLDELNQVLMEFQRCQLEERAEASVEAPRNSLDSKKREVSSDENNIELDWDAFDRDLSAMSDAVGKLGASHSQEENSHQQQQQQQHIQQLKKQLRQAQQESGDLMKRALLAEHALESAEKRNSELNLELEAGYNQDDFLEMRKALRKEQLARLELEQRLRNAHEEIKAAQFAFKVAKTVANRIADSAEISQGALMRCQSERTFPEAPHAIINSLSAPHSDQSEMELGEEEGIVVTSRSDSAYFEAKSDSDQTETACDPSNPFTQPPPHASLPQDDSITHSQESNPFLESEQTKVEEKQNPFLCPQQEDPVESTPAEDPPNPFMMAEGVRSGGPVEVEWHDDASNPFEVESDLPTDSKKDASWNPFVESSPPPSNPFLSL